MRLSRSWWSRGGTNLTKILATLAVGAALGASVSALSGKTGRRRRTLLRDQVVRGLHDVRRSADITARDVGHRARGAASEARRTLRRAVELGDDTLLDRARARLGHVCSHPHAIHVSAHAGVLDVSGPVLGAEREDLIRALRGVPGVKEVRDNLEVHADPGSVPGLQGIGRRQRALQTRPSSWTPTGRALAGAGGAGLLVLGLRRGRLLGLGLDALGALLIGRALTNLGLRRLLGVGPREGVDVQKTIHVHAPVDEVFMRFSALETFPRFMSHVREVKHVGEEQGLQRYRWRVEGPLGYVAEWDAVITRFEPGRLISWRSLEGAAVDNAGTIHFEESDRGTRMTVQLSYKPPVGAVGHLLARLFGKDPKHLLDDDLLRFQSLVESGKATGREGQVRTEDVPAAEAIH